MRISDWSSDVCSSDLAWGGGEVASADGLRFTVPVRTIHAGPNPRYFGRERGVTWYTLVSDRFSGLHAVTVPGTFRDSLHLLAVVLDPEPALRPSEIMTDTAGHNDTIFGDISEEIGGGKDVYSSVRSCGFTY